MPVSPIVTTSALSFPLEEETDKLRMTISTRVGGDTRTNLAVGDTDFLGM